MNKLPAISIITPVYNAEQYLSQCIDSIIDQTFQDWELILINDGSEDNSGIICDQYAAKDSRIRVLHKKNSGQADSRNIALSMARANLIGFVDSDDWIEPDMYETLYETLINKGVDIVICGYFIDYKNSSLPSCKGGNIIIYEKEKALKLIWEDKIIKSFPCDKLFRKAVISRPFPKAYYYEDYATLFKWFMEAERIALIESPKYHYRQRKNSTSHDGDPQKNFHFFLAEWERYHYLQNIPFNFKWQEKHKLIRVAIKEAKDIAKYSTDYLSGLEYLSKIQTKLKSLPPIESRKLGLRRHIQLWELLNLPTYFFYKVRFKHKLKFWKKNKENKFY